MRVIDTVDGLVELQDYSPRQWISGVEIRDLRCFVDDGGSLTEVLRTDEYGLALIAPGVLMQQVNFSEIAPGAIKAWHLHFKQYDAWFVPPPLRLLVGLWDVRANSMTRDVQMRFVMGTCYSQLLLIPPGVAHGCSNPWPPPSTLLYFVSKRFDPENSDEHRIPWDILGADFWQIRPG
jgi:dTDP-4-dehydrorhamnose 3,5-epimerase